MQQLKPIVFNSFDGGLRTNGHPSKIDKNESPDLGDMIALPKGAIAQRKGSAVIMDQTGSYAGNKITMLAEYKKSDADSEVLVAFGGVVKILDLSDGSISDLPTPISGHDTDALYCSGNYDDRFFFCNGVDAFTEYDGSANNSRTLTNIASTTFLTDNFVFFGRKMYAVDASDRMLLHRSRTFDGTAAYIYTFNYTGGADVENSGTTRVKEGNTPIQSLSVLDNLYLFSENNVFQGTYQTVDSSVIFVPDNVGRGVGAISRQSTVEIGNAIVFFDPVDQSVQQLGQREQYPGIYTSGMSDAIRNLFRDEYDMSESAGVYYNRMCLLACKSSSAVSGNDIVILLDLQTGGLFRITNWAVSTWMVFGDKLYFGSSTDPIVYEAFSGNDDANAVIPAYYVTKQDDHGVANTYKGSTHYYVEGTIDDEVRIQVTLEYDDGRDSITKIIEGSSTEYTFSKTGLGVLAENELGIYSTGGIIAEGDRIFRVWLKTNNSKYVNVKVKFENIGEIGSWSINECKPINVKQESEETVPSNHVI